MMVAALPKLYTPAARVSPPRFGPRIVPGGNAAAVLNAIRASLCARIARAVVTSIVPCATEPGGKPLIALPGDTPMLPVVIIVGPVFVRACPARTAN